MHQDQLAKSKLIINKNYNENVYFNNEEHKDNIPGEFHDKLHKIITNVIAERKSNYKYRNDRLLSLNCSNNNNNTCFIRDTANQIPAHDKNINETFIENMKNPSSNSIKLNLNISNNYYNVCESNVDTPTTRKMSAGKLGSKIKVPLNLQNDVKRVRDRSRFTVFLNRIFGCTNDSSKLNTIKIEDSKESVKNRNLFCNSLVIHKNSININKLYTPNSNEMPIFVPCINCNSHILFSDIDKHSEQCTYVKKEVFEVDEISDEIKCINYKLYKLEESLIKIKNQNNEEEAGDKRKYKKETHYIHILLQYVSDSKNTGINFNKHSLEEFKKILLNLETLAFRFKGSLSTQILIDRARILTQDKKRIYINILKSTNCNIDKSQDTFASKSIYYIEELQREKISKEKIVDKLKLQKEIIKNKIICQEGQEQRNSHISNSSINDSVRKAVCKPPIDLNKILVEQDSNDDLENEVLSKKIESSNTKIKCIIETRGIDYINSDIGDNHSENSFNTQITGENSNIKKDFKSMKYNFLENKSSSLSNLILSDEQNLKKQFKLFVKEFLKIKFEQLSSSHPAQKIPEKILFKEFLKENVPKQKITEFIEREINNISKYSKYIYRKPSSEDNEDGNNENIKSRPTRITRFNQRPLLEIIKEESF